MDEESLSQAIESGDEYRILKATQRIVAAQLEESRSGRDVAALSKQMQELTAKIGALEKARGKASKRSSIERARAALNGGK